MMNSKKSPRPTYRRFISQQEPRVILFSNQLHDSAQALSEQDRLGLLKIFREETDLVGGLILNFAVREKEIGLLLKLGDPSQSLSVDDAGNRLEKVWPEEKVIAWKNSLLAADPDSDAAKGLWHLFRQPIQDEGQYLGMDPKGFDLKGSNWEVFSRFYSSWLDPELSVEVRNKRNPNRAESAKLWEVLRKDSVSAFPYKTFRWMTHGGALGSKEFIETLFMAYLDQFSPERKQGARRIAGNWGGLCTLRQTGSTK